GPIRNAIDVAKQLKDPERIRASLDVIDRQSTHLTRLVDDLLDMSRITKGQIRLERRRLLISEVVDRALEAMHGHCEERGHTVTVHCQVDAVVRGDVVRLTQVLSNLLSNACKYTPSNGRIDVVIDADD